MLDNIYYLPCSRGQVGLGCGCNSFDALSIIDYLYNMIAPFTVSAVLLRPELGRDSLQLDLPLVGVDASAVQQGGRLGIIRGTFIILIFLVAKVFLCIFAFLEVERLLHVRVVVIVVARLVGLYIERVDISISNATRMAINVS